MSSKTVQLINQITSIKRMTYQGSRQKSFYRSRGISTQLTPSKIPLGTSVLTAILLLGGGSAVVPVWTNSVQATQIAQTPLSANIIYVNPARGTDTDGSGTSEATPYRTITYALQQASSGTVVQLAPGTYTKDTGEVFPLRVKQGVTLRGDVETQGQRTGIIGGGSYASPTLAGQNVTIRAEKDSEITGISITNPNTRGTGVWIESTNATVRNNSFINSKREGIFVTGTSNPKIENNLFTRNEGNGISVARQSTGEIRNNVFQETGIGISIGDSASPLVEGNRVIQNTDGVVVSGTATPVFRNNTIESNQRNGLVATGNAQPNLGTADSPGQNRIRNNGSLDVNNTTRTITIVAVGNDIDQNRIAGRVDFVAAAVATNFRDIQGHWAQAYIEALAGIDVIAGFPDGTFRPGESVTRAQFAAIIAKAFSPTPQKAASDFVDVSRNFWAYQVIQTAYRGEFLSGYPGRVFRPDERIPKVQVLVSLASGLKLRSEDTSVLSVYTDAAQIPNYALSAVAGATTKELVVNYPTLSQLNPNQNASRAEVAAFVYQALVNAGRVQPIPSPYLVRNPSSTQR
jgi:parallel beta-helix repeat protein